jgi:uncharacterized protein YmfQ (DUF2313 family)
MITSTLPCPVDIVDPFRCPTKWELWEQLRAIRPPGRAHQTHEQPVYDVDGDGNPTIDSLTTQDAFWAAYAEVLEDLHQRACALIDEFYCDTMSETRDWWHTEWGFPDACEPYESVCEKMRDVGGARCADLVALAATRGWVIECRDCQGATPAVADCASADCAVDCECPQNTIFLTIRTDLSPAYTAPTQQQAVADCASADCNSPCTPDVSELQCLIERVRHAHLKIVYEVV